MENIIDLINEKLEEILRATWKRTLSKSRKRALHHLGIWYYNLKSGTELKAFRELADELAPGVFTIKKR